MAEDFVFNNPVRKSYAEANPQDEMLERIRAVTEQIKLQTERMRERAAAESRAEEDEATNRRVTGWREADDRRLAASEGLRSKTYKMPAGTEEVVPNTGMYRTAPAEAGTVAGGGGTRGKGNLGSFSNVGVTSQEGLTESEKRAAAVAAAEAQRKFLATAGAEAAKKALTDKESMDIIGSVHKAMGGNVGAGGGVGVGKPEPTAEPGAGKEKPRKVNAEDYPTLLNALKTVRNPESISLLIQAIAEKYPAKAGEASAIATRRINEMRGGRAPATNIGSVVKRKATGQSPIENLMETLTGTGVTGPYGPNPDSFRGDIPWYMRQGR